MPTQNFKWINLQRKIIALLCINLWGRRDKFIRQGNIVTSLKSTFSSSYLPQPKSPIFGGSGNKGIVNIFRPCKYTLPDQWQAMMTADQHTQEDSQLVTEHNHKNASIFWGQVTETITLLVRNPNCPSMKAIKLSELVLGQMG